MPAAKSNKAYKFAKPFQGPYRVVWLYENGAELQLVDHPRASPIRVAMNRLRLCPTELAGMPASTPPSAEESPNYSQEVEDSSDPPKEPDQSGVSEVWANHLCPRKQPVKGDRSKDGEM